VFGSDIKPGNICSAAALQISATFGIAEALDVARDRAVGPSFRRAPRLAQPMYAAPEQSPPTRTPIIGPTSMLGVVAYEILGGHPVRRAIAATVDRCAYQRVA
jgi:hypothetical protein